MCHTPGDTSTDTATREGVATLDIEKSIGDHKGGELSQDRKETVPTEPGEEPWGRVTAGHGKESHLVAFHPPPISP